MKSEITLPLIIRNSKGKILEIGTMNDRSYEKTMERKSLWKYHALSGRLIADEKWIQVQTVIRGSHWYELVVFTAEPHSSLLAPAVSEPHSLNRLQTVIHQRKKDLPEGSYTTYLFSKGGEKIRKKVAEEAVEVVLASKKDDIIRESADLIYHLIVLMESENISFSEVMDELNSR